MPRTDTQRAAERQAFDRWRRQPDKRLPAGDRERLLSQTPLGLRALNDGEQPRATFYPREAPPTPPAPAHVPTVSEIARNIAQARGWSAGPSFSSPPVAFRPVQRESTQAEIDKLLAQTDLGRAALKARGA
jgi:hypothetical protein